MSKEKLKEIAGLFLKLGCVAFGGPAAHIAMMEDEVVTRRKWMDRQHFLDLVGATNLIPGPNSTEMTMHCGRERAGWPGLIVAGACFIFPAVVITGVFAWLYQAYGTLPAAEPFLKGIKPAVLAIIASAILKLGQKAMKNTALIVLGALVFLAALAGLNEIIALLAGGVLGAFYFYITSGGNKNNLSFFLPLLLFQVSTVTNLSTFKIFWTFLKVGAILYGSGYVLFAYLDAELVSNGWLSRQTLMDAVAVGQLTPGPVLSTATFIGFQMNGIPGALAATAGIFLPSFFLVALLNPIIPKMRKSKILAGFLDSANIAAVAVMLVVLVEMGMESLADWQAFVIAGLCALLVFGPWKISTLLTVVIGAVTGYLLYNI